MNKIISKKRLSDNVYRMDIEAPLVASERKAGQFIILMVDADMGERKEYRSPSRTRTPRRGRSP